MNAILIYLVPQIHKDVLSKIHDMRLEEFQYLVRTNSFQFVADNIMFNYYDDIYHLVINGVHLKIDKNNVFNFWF